MTITIIKKVKTKTQLQQKPTLKKYETNLKSRNHALLLSWYFSMYVYVCVFKTFKKLLIKFPNKKH